MEQLVRSTTDSAKPNHRKRRTVGVFGFFGRLITFSHLTSWILSVSGCASQGVSVAQVAMDKHLVVPDVIDKAPAKVLQVSYNDGKNVVDLGNVLTPTIVKDPPKVEWEGDASKYYLLCMTDPDAPTRSEPKFREWHHWLVGNIPGGALDQGEVLSAYIGSAPPKGTGLHRYVFLLYEQPGKLEFTEQRLPNTSGDNRGLFSIKKFADKYKLGDPIAANLFQAEWDEYCAVVYEQLAGKK